MSVEAPPMEMVDIGNAMPARYVGEVVIAGSGLAACAAAIRLRQERPDRSVTIVEKASPESNTQIAGQRYREGEEGLRTNPQDEVVGLMATRNEGTLTFGMEEFSTHVDQALRRWIDMGIPSRPELDSFGPQWGNSNESGSGRGLSVLRWFRAQAKDVGVTFLKGEAQHLDIEDGNVEGLIVTGINGLRKIIADKYVLANGSAGGQLFLSTNKAINWSAQELAFGSGLSVVDSTLHMIHPFGRCDEDGAPLHGCFETDALAGVEVYLEADGKLAFDEETTELLRTHKAHGAFPAIVERFRNAGSVVTLKYPDGEDGSVGKTVRARVSHHYSHLAIETTDGISVRGTNNLYAVGDASGLGYWTNHRIRLPGFALTKCLVDAELLHERMDSEMREFEDMMKNGSNDEMVTSPRSFMSGRWSKMDLLELRLINSSNLDAWLAATDPEERDRIGKEWMSELQAEPQVMTTALGRLSLAIAYAHSEVGSERQAEPFAISRDLLDDGLLVGNA